MKKTIRTIVCVLMSVVFVASACTLIYKQIQLRENAVAQNEAQQLIDLPEPSVPLAEPELPVEQPVEEPEVEVIVDEPTELPEPVFTDEKAEMLLNVDLGELKGMNEDVIGWIEIPDTPISYPLLQGKDNQYYLNHNWKKDYNAGGSIFMEAQNRADFSNFNTLIYGHRMSDSSMFNSLRHYESEEYLAKHQRVYIVTEQGVRVYEVVAAMKVMVKDPVYWLISDQEKYMQKMIDFCLENSVIEGNLTPNIENRFLTLSTCTGLTASDDRWVVVAVEVGIVSALSEKAKY